MTEGIAARLAGAVLTRFIAGLVVVALLLSVPASSLRYREGWLYLGVLFVPIAFAGLYLLKHDPELLERRMKCGHLNSTSPDGYMQNDVINNQFPQL